MIDIALVAALLYQVYKLLKGSVAIKIFLGFLSIYLIYLLVGALRMELLSSILGQFMGVGVIAAIIIFAPEIRKFLLLIGRSSILSEDNAIRNILFFWKKRESASFNIAPIIDASKTLAGGNTGALIVISRSTELKFYAESGDVLDADLSKRLLLSIFNKFSPLHDGAVIIHDGKIKAARCILPVTEREVPAQFGLRHRAGIGMSEATDAMILIISEETGQVSMAKNGKILHNLSFQSARELLNDYLHNLEVDSRFENLEDYEALKKRKMAMTTKSQA